VPENIYIWHNATRNAYVAERCIEIFNVYSEGIKLLAGNKFYQIIYCKNLNYIHVNKAGFSYPGTIDRITRFSSNGPLHVLALYPNKEASVRVQTFCVS
jgi:hypothetical protein